MKIEVAGKTIQFDETDLSVVAEYDWYLDSHGYAVARKRVDGKYLVVKMHRLILNPPEGLVVDHVNGDSGDNRRCNLRACTQMQNLRNRKINKNNTSGFKGVYRKPSGSWVAEIKCDRKRYRLGTFSTASEAHQAYLKASKELHGEFCRAA